MSVNMNISVYKKVFEFIKSDGIEPLQNLTVALKGIYSPEQIVERRLYKGKDCLSSIIRDNKVAINFIRQFPNGISDRMSIFDKDFASFIVQLGKSLDSIDAYINNATFLDELKVCRVSLVPFINILELPTIMKITRDRQGRIVDINKMYSDQEISYKKLMSIVPLGNCEEYKMYFDGDKSVPSWLLFAENHVDNTQNRYAYLTSFAFDQKEFPSEEELSSYEEPAKIKYR